MQFSTLLFAALLFILNVHSDSHGCLSSAGYSWCESKYECYRPFEEDCPVCAEGQRWCESLKECYFPLGGSCPYCPQDMDWCHSSQSCYMPIGGYCEDAAANTVSEESIEDSNGCLTSGGYSWCPSLERCYRPFEEVCPTGGDSNGCLSSAGYHWCGSLQGCYRPFEENCPYCSNGRVWCQSSQSCYMAIGGYCEDSASSESVGETLDSEDHVAGKVDQAKEITSGEVEVTANAVFTSSESGVEGTVIVDENGNIFINLDVSKLDTSVCDVEDTEEIVFEYAIHSKWEYGKGDIGSKHGPQQCTLDINGEEYNPFEASSCAEYDTTQDKYFACSMGDLSGRFGVAEPDDDNKIEIVGNISETDKDNESGFCVSRLTPESLYQRSIVFRCKDSKSTYLFCAPFQIQKVNIGS